MECQSQLRRVYIECQSDAIVECLWMFLTTANCAKNMVMLSRLQVT